MDADWRTNNTSIDIHMDPISTKDLALANKSANDSIYRTKYKWRATNHKHTIFNERIFDNDSTRANIIDTIRRKREARARYYDSIKAAINGIRFVKRQISQIANAINKQHKLFISRIRECTNTINKLTERIRESDIYSREICDTTREFEEVARKHVLSRIPEDIKIDASKIKRKDIKDIWAGGDMGMG
ncbi:hypothetical protein [Campylobacter sp.]|uniref:hypothetical protein n=1 Tax=Campylobacter sp. TaxID=205 RepID=UPI003FA07E86